MTDENSEKEAPFIFPVIKKTVQELFEEDEITPAKIQAFQEKYWDQLVPNFSQALKLLDIHDVSRHQVIWAINERLLESLRPRIESKRDENDSKKTQKLWQKLMKSGISYINHPFVRPIIMQVLGKMTSLKDKYSKIILDNPELYKETPLPVLRHIWQINMDKFNEKVIPIIDGYIHSWNTQIIESFKLFRGGFDVYPILNCFTKRRRKDSHLNELIDIIGDNEKLYANLLALIRERAETYHKRSRELIKLDEIMENHETYREDKSSNRKKKIKIHSLVQKYPLVEEFLIPFLTMEKNMFLSQLRFDLIMSLNDSKVESVSKTDTIHRIVWCLDACIRNRKIDQRHSSEMAGHLKRKRQVLEKQSIEEAKTELEGQSKRPKKNSSFNKDEISDLAKEIMENSDLEVDLQIICQDPCVLHIIITSIIRIAMNDISQDSIPRDSSELHFLVNLLSIGLKRTYHLPEGIKMPILPMINKLGVEVPRTTTEQEVYVSIPEEIEKAVIQYIIPAICLLQLNIWRSQLADEIKNVLNKSQVSAASPMTPRRFADFNSPSSPPSNEINLNNLADNPNISSPMKKRIEESVKHINMSICPIYLLHPIGHLFIQYHALFALERRDWILLRIILRGILTHIQNSQMHPKRNQRTKTSSTSEEVSPSPGCKRSLSTSSTTSDNMTEVPFIFRWRSDCLQSLALGLVVAPNSNNAQRSENSLSFDFDETNSESSLSKSSNSHVTRNELISLLKSTMSPILNDFQISVLVYLNRILINSTPEMSEKERYFFSLQKYINPSGEYDELEVENIQSNILFSSSNTQYRSCNPTIVSMIDNLKTELDNARNSGKINLVSMTPGPSILNEQATSLSSINPPKNLMGPPSITTPLNKQSMPPPFSIKSPAYNTMQMNTNLNRKSYDIPLVFPSATPLTNPGLSTPYLSSSTPSSASQISSPKND